MEQWEREFYIARIMAGKINIKVESQRLFVVSPNREQRLIACEIYRDARRDAELDGALTEQELFELLVNQNLWSLQDETEMGKLLKASDDLKVGLFENRLKSNARSSIRAALKKTLYELSRLNSIRHGLDYVTLDGLALSAKYRYMIGVGIRYEDGTPYWEKYDRNMQDPLIDKVMENLSAEHLSESQFRELARSEPWRSTWSYRNSAGRGLFDCGATDLTDEQKNIMLWSTIYDNIREYPDCPNEDIVSDDDMLDGWMIIQRRKRESQAASQEADRIGNEKIRNANEQFIFVDTIEDAREVDKMNTPGGAMTKAQRMAFLKSKGVVKEVEFPDMVQRIAMEKNQLEQMKMRQGKGK